MGMGIGFLFMPSVSIPAQWFHRKRALAIAMVTSGAGFGGIMFSLGLNAIIENISLQWSFRISAIIAFTLQTIATILIRDRVKILDAKYKSFDWVLLKNRGFQFMLVWGMLSMLPYVIVLFSLSPYAVAIGLTQKKGSIVTSLYSVGVIIGRPSVGLSADRFGRINLAILSAWFTGLTNFIVWLPARSMGPLCLFAFLQGFFSGYFWVLGTSVAAEVLGLQNLGSGLSFVWLSVTPFTIPAEVIALAIVDKAKSNGKEGADAYLGAIIFSGFLYILSGVALCGTKWWKQKQDGVDQAFKILKKV